MTAPKDEAGSPPDGGVHAVQAPVKRKPGPAPDLTPELVEKWVNAAQLGLRASRICRLLGIRWDAFKKWKWRGKKGVEPYASFLRKVEEGESLCEARLVKILHSAAATDTETAKWLLSRRFAESWASPMERLARAEKLAEAKASGKSRHVRPVVHVPMEDPHDDSIVASPAQSDEADDG
jgi:hypothetical protein